MKYKIIGPCRVLGKEPGETVTHEELVEDGANVQALIGYHLEPADAEAKKKAVELTKGREEPEEAGRTAPKGSS